MKDMWMLLFITGKSKLGPTQIKELLLWREGSNIVCLCRFFSLPGPFGQLRTPFSCLYWVNWWRRCLGPNAVFTMTLVLVPQTHPGVPIGWPVFTVSFGSTSFTSHFHMDRDLRTLTYRSLWCSEYPTMPRFPWELFCTVQDALERTGMRSETIWHTSPPPQRLCLLANDF